MNSMPSVWMKAGMPSLTTITPLSSPIAAPTPIPPRMATVTGSAAAVISLAATTADRPATEPTDRSNSPATSRMVWPMAMMPTNDTTLRMARMLRSDRKAGSSSQKKTISRAIAASTPTSPMAMKPISRRRKDCPSRGGELTSAALSILTSLAGHVAGSRNRHHLAHANPGVLLGAIKIIIL
ncbi:hypothetical protein MPL1032_110231 [Mesorhizobium plurifarium]|uniref:Uncharacterized protein n=1 Tax=Mesorhizobium plurifarium TaxID=69974 RepID=A0A0K2VQF9_MESPL|nr:hypothetical protein MPL1032_110231 [Mesorhizobium plurifarium]